MPAGAATLPSLRDLATRYTVACAANSNITTPGDPESAAPTSLACGASGETPVPLSGDFGAAVPILTYATASDPDDLDAIFSVGDTISLGFGVSTDRGGFALNANVPRADVDRLFNFTPSLPPDAVFTARWIDDATLNLTFTSVNTRRAAAHLRLGAEAESGSIRAFTFSEFLEALIHVACKRSPPGSAVPGSAAGNEPGAAAVPGGVVVAW